MNWQRLIFDNLGWKLGSLFIAMMIWSSYKSSEVDGLDIGSKFFRNLHSKEFIGRQIQVLSPQNRPQTIELMPRFVTISMKGEREVVEPVTLSDVLVYVDVSTLQPGTTNQVPVQVKVPPNVLVDYVTPSNVTVRVPAPAPTP